MSEEPKPEVSSRTVPMSARELSRAARAHKEREATAFSLLFRHRNGVEVVSLAEGRSLVVGRAHPADVEIRDETLSRQHASFEVLEGELWVEDLGSTNGTRVDGMAVERFKVPPGAELTLGAVAVEARHLDAGESPVEGLEAHDRFLRALAAECARARAHGRSLAVLLVRGAAREAGRLGEWLSTVTGKLHPYDTAALYGPDTVEVLLPEMDVEAAAALALAVAAGGPSLRCAVAALPDHAASSEELLEVATAALRAAREDAPVQVAAAPSVRPPVEGDGPVVRSPAMVRVFESARRFGDATMPVLVRGETGTGKEVVARAIHESGPRREAPLLSVNCGAIPGQLVESTLFGHEKGAFTGAHQQRQGIFESADRGTVFLDEIGEMPLEAQTALLRVLETGRFTRVGSTKEIQVDVRIVAATHRDLERMCEEGAFRSDLFYRLDAMAISIPPLRERPEEIEPLVERFLARASAAAGRDASGVEEDALDLLRRYPWPGNVRELRNAIERAVVIARGALVTVDDLPERVARLARSGPARPAPAQTEPRRGDVVDLRAEVARFETELIRRALDGAGGDRTAAANDLGLPVRTLYYKMKQLGIAPAGRK